MRWVFIIEIWYYMTLLPHNHNMFAVIGIYHGREDNMFWRRIDDATGKGTSPGIEAAGAESMGAGQVATLYQGSVIMTHLTAILGPLVRSGRRRGAPHHKPFATRRAGLRSRPPVGPSCPPEGVAALARCVSIALRTAPTRRAARTHEMSHYYRALVLGRDIIHSVANPITKLTSAIHVYGGDFFKPPTPRSQWNHESLVEQAWDMDHTRAVFRQAEARYNAGLAAGLDP